ncbi:MULTISPECIES: hypothetical protein [unclassified Rhizobium]|uniref:hypothetical protein n=1 Tax=unclassified Rhizobium TaxID=2613769 RepID=UPI00138F014A|nr:MULTISPECIES: hypothetical protein [unclassified Rhizobium]
MKAGNRKTRICQRLGRAEICMLSSDDMALLMASAAPTRFSSIAAMCGKACAAGPRGACHHQQARRRWQDVISGYMFLAGRFAFCKDIPRQVQPLIRLLGHLLPVTRRRDKLQTSEVPSPL